MATSPFFSKPSQGLSAHFLRPFHPGPQRPVLILSVAHATPSGHFPDWSTGDQGRGCRGLCLLAGEGEQAIPPGCQVSLGPAPGVSVTELLLTPWASRLQGDTPALASKPHSGFPLGLNPDHSYTPRAIFCDHNMVACLP